MIDTVASGMSATRKKKNKNDYLLEMNEKDKEINHKIIKNMNKRVNYLKNPRFKINKAPVLFSYLTTKQDIVTNKDVETQFRIQPKQVIFRDYMLNGVYEIALYATNASGLLQRIKVLPPEKVEFQIASIEYPSSEIGYIAPGMSAIIRIRFNPSSLAEFDDQIAILSEDHILKIPIMARKEPPQLDLPSRLDCQSCWLGDEVETKFVVTNSGGEAGYRFFAEGLEINEEDNFIQLGNFYLSPAEFFLHKGEQQIIHAIFRPDREGNVEETIILGCDNQTQAPLTLLGRGNMIELGIAGIDSVSLESAREQLQKIFFSSPIPNSATLRKLKIRNKTSVKVKYHWFLQSPDKEFSLGDEPQPYQVSPSEGYFQPNETIDFDLILKSEDYYPLFQNAFLIIDEIPFESIRNPPPQLKVQFERSQSQVVIGSNSSKPSITYFEFEFISKSALSTVTASPPFYKFPLPICRGTLATYDFVLKSSRAYILNYEIVPLGHDEYIEKRQGQIKGQQTIKLGFQTDQLGPMEISFRIDFDFADSIVISLLAEVIAPIISINSSWIDYGLVQTYSLESKEVILKNESPVLAIIKAESGSDQRLSFNKDQFEIKPHQTHSFKVEFNSREAETYHDFLSFTVEGGECYVLEIFAEVQNPSVSLNRLSLNIDTLYCGNTYTFDQRAQQYIVLQNLGNIQTPFEWQVPENTDRYLVQFDPKKGVLKPKSNQVIKFSIKPKEGGEFNEIFVCDIQGIQYPLGFEMKSMIYGLSVEYELVDDTVHISSKTSVSSKGRTLKRSESRKSVLKTDTEMKPHLMEKLEFYNCTINKPKQMKFLIKNTSGIHTQFSLFMRKYQPHPLDEQSTLHDDFDAKSMAARTIKFAESSISKSVSKKGKLTQTGRPVVLLTNKIEKTQNFTSEEGLRLVKQKKMEHDQRVYLSNNLGIAVVFEPSQGTLNAYGSVVVQVTVFNDICGLFEDTMCCDIRGLPTKEFPVTIDIKGSPIVISSAQLGFTYRGDFPSFDLGNFMRNFGTMSRDFRVQNTGPQDIDLEWKIYNLGGTTNQELFDIRITDPALGSEAICDVQFIAQEPPESLDGPFSVVPQKERIRGRKEKHFTLHFSTKDTNLYNACLVAHPRLVSNDQKIGEVAFYVKAETMTPQLHFDKLEKLDGGHQVKFQKWSSGPCRKQKKRLVLVNRQKSSLVCTFELEGPFKLIKTSTNSPQKYELGFKSEIQKSFNLVSGSHVELEIFFEGYLPSDPVNWPLTYKVYHHGTITIYFANGDKQTLTLEGVLLRPLIHLNTSGIDNDEGPEVLDFGEVQEEKVFPIYITNMSLVPAKWSLQHEKNPLRKNIVEKTMTLEDKEEMKKTDDPSVFEFQTTSGVLEGPSTMVHTLPHATCMPHQITIEEIRELGMEPFKIMIRFKPKQELLYKSKYRIRVQDGPSVEFVLRGTGRNLIVRKI